MVQGKDKVLKYDNRCQIQKRIKDILKKARKPREFAEELHKIFESTSKKKRLEQVRRVIPDACKTKVFGTKHSILNIIGEEIGKFSEENLEQALEIVKELWENGSLEERIIVAKSLERIGKVDYKSTLHLIISFSKDISNWAVCDHLGFSGMRAITPYYLKELFPLLHKWSKDSNKWIRRLAMASLTPLVRDKKYKLSGEEFAIISNLMKDEDRDVKKGVSWVLREFTKKDSQKVLNFLIKWAKSKPDKNTKWVIKDGMKKLPKEKQAEILKILELSIKKE